MPAIAKIVQPPKPKPRPPPKMKQHRGGGEYGQKQKRRKFESDDESEEEESEEEEDKPMDPKKYCFETPLRMCVVGESGSGKTEWVIDYLIHCPFDQVIWCGPEHSIKQKSLQRLKDFYKKEDDNGKMTSFFTPVDCTDGVDHDKIQRLIDNGHKQDWQTACVFDDCIMFAKDKKIGTLFVSGRHQNVSVFELTQQIFPPGSRVHRINCSQFVCFKFPAVNEFTNLATQVCADKKTRQQLVDKYKSIINKNPHGCIIIDMKSKSTPRWPCRVRDTKINRFVPQLFDL